MNYTDLPVYQHKDLILEALGANQVVVVESPTGSGKTTQMPLILHDAGFSRYGIIGVTQPRRIAALSVSEFIARQIGETMPGTVGYKMRFEDKTGRDTRIKIMTDGILLQEMKLDPWLSRYNCIVVDEAHERSLNIDFILGLLKRVLVARPEFKVIISSATINAQAFAEYFGDFPGLPAREVPVVRIDAQTYPVTLIYDPPEQVSGELAAEALLAKIEGIAERVVSEKREGDILIFLPGEKMIKDCMGRLVLGPLGEYLQVLPLYGRLAKEEQERVFDPAPGDKTKVVIATNIAETSVTIDGITTVIDSGLAKLNFYNPRTFTASLVEDRISKASANQRKGRAGRTRPGTCYRLYARKDFEARPLYTTEEIFRTDLSEVVLRMADLGVTAFEDFDFISPPGREGILAAIETLKLLDALEDDHRLSATGKMMTGFPLAPRHSRMIVEALQRYPKVTGETIIAAAFLSTQNPYVLPPGEETDARRAHHRFRDPGGDFVSYLRLLAAYRDAPLKGKFCEKNYLDERALAEIENVTRQLEEIVSGTGLPVLSGGPVQDYLSCVTAGLIQFVCVREGSGSPGSREMYRSLTADRILIHPGSVMFKASPEYLVAGEIIRTARMYAMSVSPLSREVLERLPPELLEALSPGGAAGRAAGGSRPGGRRAAGRAEGRARDLGNTIRIGPETFALETIKGRKTAILPWEKLGKIADTLGEPSVYRNLRGIISLEGGYTLLAGEKLSLILSLAPGLRIEGALERRWKKQGSFNSGAELDALIAELPLLLAPAVWKRGGGKSALSKDKSAAPSKELGFIGLFSDGAGNYWFRCSRGFHTSLNESLSSLESLIDELGEEVDVGKKHVVNQTYRRLSDYLS